jgi:hypothetical protein
MITTKQSPISKFMEMVEKKNPAKAGIPRRNPV